MISGYVHICPASQCRGVTAPRRRDGSRRDTSRHGVTVFWNCSATFLSRTKICIIQGTSVRRHSVEASRRQGVAAGGVATHRDTASLIFGTAVQLFFLMCTSVRRHSVEASRCQGVVAGGIATHRDTASQFLELQCKLSFSCQNLYNIGNTSVLRHSVKASRRQGVAAGGFATHCDTASRFFGTAVQLFFLAPKCV